MIWVSLLPENEWIALGRPRRVIVIVLARAVRVKTPGSAPGGASAAKASNGTTLTTPSVSTARRALKRRRRARGARPQDTVGIKARTWSPSLSFLRWKRYAPPRPPEGRGRSPIRAANSLKKEDATRGTPRAGARRPGDPMRSMGARMSRAARPRDRGRHPGKAD